ncbi:MAG: 3-hydroxyacyl-CoA dehydrogenase NAD-binding domain-containing protein [Bdellovibrionales bacterium]|nr:3-hydroxyacyl-CoA dehydrogenase NAD-binding domain-containing protein [Bdellovibrionales bacterium]
MSIQESIQIKKVEDNIAYVELDLVGEKVNKLSSPVMERLREVIEELKSSSYKAVVLISKKKNIFIAGADIEEIKKMNKKEDFMDAVTKAHEIINAWEDLPMPTLAAINGACLGGGCELSLACDYRIATDSKSLRIGLPEVQLGIIPGFGGCIRMPRLIGLPNSLDIILAGKSVDSRKAEKIGLIDKQVPEALFEETVKSFAQDMASGKKSKRKTYFKPKSMMDSFLHSFAGRPVVFKQAKKTVMKQSKGFYPAPLKALEVIKSTYGFSNRQRALITEANGFCEVAVTDVSKHLINLFFVLENVKKQTGVEADVEFNKVQSMGVLGAGVMGGGIAYVGADKGVSVRMKDINNDALSKGFKAARDIWNKKLKRKRLTKYELAQKESLISGTLDYSGFKSLDLVVEAIVEDMNIKKKVIEETAKHCKEDCIIATNTSSLSVTEMAEAHPKPELFAGMHFFNPVDKMPLVEVIKGPKTSDSTVASIFELSKRMGKTPIVVKDGPGFLVNRLLLPLLAEALYFLEEGCDIATVDKYYTHTFGLPMGPFRLMDEVGLDVCIKVLKIFKKALGERVEVSDLAEKLAGTDRLGKKNSKGFYNYDEKGKETSVDNSVYADLGLSSPSGSITSKEAIERGIFLMINEASRVLFEDHIVEKPEDVDLGMIMGTGFPPFRGGLLRYADSLGAEYVVQELEQYATKCGPRFKPCQSLVNLANAKKSFY